MPKYLFEVSYNADGMKGLLKEGGSSRVAQATNMVQGLGGKVELFYHAFGETDAFTIVDVPDAATAAAISQTANATGAVRVRTMALMTPEDIDQAS
jgi:uncharacterized protein with GYD domain